LDEQHGFSSLIRCSVPAPTTNAVAGRPRILVLTSFYEPGFRAGGPIRTLANLVETLGDTYDFHVLTLDHDLGHAERYGVPTGRWIDHGKGRVCYLRDDVLAPIAIARLVVSREFQVVYLNSCFARLFSIWPLFVLRVARMIGLTPGKLLLAPRGEFSAGALDLKSGRKMWFLSLAHWLGLHRGATWHASSEFEAADIRRVIGLRPPRHEPLPVLVAPDLGRGGPAEASAGAPRRPLPKRPGEATVVFIARVVPMKNLAFALATLARVQGRVRFRLCGPREDQNYWRECEPLLRTLPAGISVEFVGEIPHAQVAEVLAEAHLLFLPTLGENFGHVIHEALTAGCPVLISDRTPWRDLAANGAGWDLPLHDPAAFVAALERVVGLDVAGWQRMAAAARRYVQSGPLAIRAVEQNTALFRQCLVR